MPQQEQQQNIRTPAKQEEWEAVKHDMLKVIEANEDPTNFFASIGITDTEIQRMKQNENTFKQKVVNANTIAEAFSIALEEAKTPAQFVFYARVLGYMEGKQLL